jgi:hypothetical protein
MKHLPRIVDGLLITDFVLVSAFFTLMLTQRACL